MRFIIIASIAAGLTGCVSTPEQRMAADDTKCRSYGVQPGSQPYVECRLRLDQQRADQRAINSTGAIGFLQNLGEQ